MDLLVGRWETFDFLAALFANNLLLKAAIIGACMAAAWSFGKTPEETFAARRRMILVLLAALCAAGYTKVAGRLIAYPSPMVLTHQTLRFEDERLTPYRTIAFPTPADAGGAKRMAEIQRGVIGPGDWESFPSNQAALFGALALGLLWVKPSVGWIASAWLLAVIFPAMLLRGMHRLSDLFAGLAVALLALFLWSLLERNGLLARVTQWSMRRNALATALFFLVAYEAANALGGVQDLALSARDLLRVLSR